METKLIKGLFRSVIGGVFLLSFLGGVAGCLIEKSPIEKLREERSELRVYDGAPPVVPHSIEGSAYATCTHCHARGARFKSGKVAPIIPHNDAGNCLQCHVPQLTTKDYRDNLFTPYRLTKLRSPDEESTGAPPYMPHSSLMRDNCAVCHLSKTSPEALKPAHELRENCAMCHMPEFELP